MATTIKQIIAMLQTLPNQDMPLMVASDPEGNDFHPLAADFSYGILEEDGEFHHSAYTEDGEEYSVTADEATHVCLWP